MGSTVMLFKNILIILIIASPAWITTWVQAAPLTFNVDGVISDSSNNPLEVPAVIFRIEVKNSAETCLLYREDFTVAMTDSGGYFSLAVGKQSNAVSGGLTLDKVFSNQATAIPGQSCSYTPASTTETRKIIVSFNDGNSTQVFSTQEIQSVPFALEAVQATKVGDYSPNEILKVDPTVSQATNTNNALNQAQYDEFWKLLLGTSTTYLKIIPTLGGDVSGTLPAMSVDKIKGYAVATPAGAGDNGKVLTFNSVTGWSLQAPSLTPGDSSYAAKGLVQFDTSAAVSGVSVTAGVAKVNAGTAANQIVQLDGTAKLPVVDGSQLTAVVVPDSSITSTKILDGTIANTDISGTAAIAWSKIASPTTLAGYGITDAVNKSGDTMSGALAMGGFNLTNTGNITMAANKYLGLSANTTDGTVAGQMWYDTGTIKYFDGSAVKSLSAGGGGAVTNTATLAPTKIWIGDVGSKAQEFALSGDATMTSGGVVTVDKTQVAVADKILQLDSFSVAVSKGVDIGGPSSGKVSLRYPSTPTDTTLTFPSTAGFVNQFLQTDGSGNLSWVNGSSGTVTSVSGTAPISVATGTSTPVISITAGSTTGQALRWNGSAWAAGFIAMTDLRSTVTGSNSFATTCAANQTLTYNSVGDIMSCANIAIANNQVSGLGNLSTKSAADLTTDVSGVLPVTNGGTGTSNGSITGAGALTIVAGGTNQDVTIAPSGTAKIVLSTAVVQLVGDSGTIVSGSTSCAGLTGAITRDASGKLYICY